MNRREAIDHDPTSIAYRLDIDGLRALAVTLVVAFHAFPHLFPGGYIGVDVFFVISGYLISGIIVRALQEERFSLADFYARRFRRILPALFLMMMVIGVMGWLVLTPVEFRDLGGEMVAGAGFGENMLMMLEAGYFDVQSLRKPLLHLWSLGVEEQFYLVWPLLLIAAHRLRWRMGWLTLVLGTLSFLFCVIYSHLNPMAAFYVLPTRFWELLCGAALASLNLPAIKSRLLMGREMLWSNVVPGLACAGLIAFALFFKQGGFFTRGYLLLCCLGAMALIASPQSWLARKFLAHPAMVGLGRISYPLYLWHWPLLSLLYITEEGTAGTQLILAAVSLAVLLATATYYFIELPLRQQILTSKLRKPVFLASAAGIILLGGLGLLMHARSEQMISLAPQFSDVPKVDIDQGSYERTLDRDWWGKNHEHADLLCSNSDWVGGHHSDYCRLTNPVPRIAIIGDSHANHLVPGLVALHNPILSNLVQISFGGCNAVGGMATYNGNQPADRVRDCIEGNRYFREKIANDREIKLVIISIKHYSNVDFSHTEPGNIFKADIVEPSSDFEGAKLPLDVLRVGLSQTITEMERAGKQVVYINDVPDLGVDPVDCVFVRRFSLRRGLQSCKIARDRVDGDQQEEPRHMIAALKAAHPQMIVYNPLPTFCDAVQCYGIIGRRMLYRDADHLSEDGSIFLAKDLAKTLNADHVVP